MKKSPCCVTNETRTSLFPARHYQNNLNPILASRWPASPGGYLQNTWRGRGGGGPTELHIVNPKNYKSLKLYTQKNTWHQNILPKRNTRLSTSILIYSIKQTLRPKKIPNRSPDPKKYRGCKFSTEKICWTSLSCILQVPPPGLQAHILMVIYIFMRMKIVSGLTHGYKLIKVRRLIKSRWLDIMKNCLQILAVSKWQISMHTQVTFQQKFALSSFFFRQITLSNYYNPSNT